MLIDVRPILSGAVDRLSFDYRLPAPAPLNGVTFPCEVHVAGLVRSRAGLMTLEAETTVPYETNCARCLKPLSGVFTHTFTRTLATKLENEDNDDYLIIRNDRIDIDESLLEDLILNLGFVYLCKEDCKGLCPKCGKDLNEGDCGCSSVKEIDPRLAILAKLLDK